jgi:hypothetical protein
MLLHSYFNSDWLNIYARLSIDTLLIVGLNLVFLLRIREIVYWYRRHLRLLLKYSQNVVSTKKPHSFLLWKPILVSRYSLYFYFYVGYFYICI